MKTLFQVFIDSYFVRRTQVYCGDFLSDDIDIFDDEHDRFWSDSEDPIMVLEGFYESVEDVATFLHTMYPDASANVFTIKHFPDIKAGGENYDITTYESVAGYADCMEVETYYTATTDTADDTYYVLGADNLSSDITMHSFGSYTDAQAYLNSVYKETLDICGDDIEYKEIFPKNAKVRTYSGDYYYWRILSDAE